MFDELKKELQERPFAAMLALTFGALVGVIVSTATGQPFAGIAAGALVAAVILAAAR